MPRDGEAIVADLAAGLKAAGVAGPYILVGHSAGGLYVRLFAERHRSDVAGLVLVDPSVVHQDVRIAAVFGPGAGSLAPLIARTQACLSAARKGALPSTDPALSNCPPARPPAADPPGARASLYEAEISELETLFARTSDEVVAAGPQLGATPLVVLTAARTQGGDSQGARLARDVWANLHQEIARLSTRGSARQVEGSSHMMMFDQPQAIVTAIGDVAALMDQ
jgi:pimeloyl-ACP methyl ester carboxylesterase